MSTQLRTLDDLNVSGKTVLLRADLNVPLHTVGEGDGAEVEVGDDKRIRASIPTINWLRDRGARVVILAHLGRPKGKPDPALSLRPVAERLSQLLGAPVLMADDVCGPAVEELVASMAPGDVTLLENVRFDPRETSKDDRERIELAQEWAELGSRYVSDGFGVVHREQASVTDLALLLPAVAGLLVAKEVAAFDEVLGDPPRPYTVVLGGSKVSDKLKVVGNLLPRVDRLIIGGGMCFTFLAAQGLQIGGSLVELDQIDAVADCIAQAAERGVQLLLPTDVVIAREISSDTETKIVDVADGIPDGWMGLDIGPRTAARFAAAIISSATVVWNGPMGVFEVEPFSAGTRAVAEAMTQVDGTSVVGGGDSAAALHQLGIDESAITHISTGGGASLELLEGRTLPGLAVLRRDDT